jgi:NADPH-dependent 2,4-dienoyl-CoA reductase/sulfur reductase-like enzyme
MDDIGAGRAIVVGGGYIGLEMAEALLQRGFAVSLVERDSEVMSTIDRELGARVSEVLEKDGVTLYREESLTGFDVGRDGRLRAVVTDKRELPADMAILGMGVRPNSGLAREAGISLGAKDAIVVNDRMETSADGVYAAGDCVQSFHRISRRSFYVALGTVANKQGRVAGINIGGGKARFPGVLGTAITKFGDMGIARTGLQERETQKIGLEAVSETIDAKTRAGYYPGAERITVKLTAEEGSGRLLGGQIVGALEGAKRIDTVAAALQGGLAVQDLIDLDLSYAPPFSPVWDPVQIAARQLIKKV